MNNTALITGASSGIGLDLAKIHAKLGGDLVLVARNKQKLLEIKNEFESNYHIEVVVIEQDLSRKDAAQEVYNQTKQQGISIDILINNAGFGDFGFFAETDWFKEYEMISLNIVALTQLTKLYAQDMISNGSGRILNVASVAAFLPGPKMAIYYATKAYVLSFSEAIANEFAANGITVTTLCPGPTDTGFEKAAALEESGLFKKQKVVSSMPVAEFGYKAMMKGKTVAIPGFTNKLLTKLILFVPRSWVVKAVRYIQD
ncbi:MAG TPA: SDR family oxidoreductase [Bacteroidales bacterium]|mgnify:CR=1 FL=1|jgi:short-subunit dehydrogenase|nr:SDR family oxidoreductase [Bacteroidales bacterium]